MTQADFDGLKSPVRKLARFFRTSRDSWKSKFSQLKKDAKRLQNRVNDVTKSREAWKEKALKAERQVAELQQSCESAVADSKKNRH